MDRKVNNRAIWYPKCDADKMGEKYRESMFYHLTEGVFKPFVDLVKESESDNSKIPSLMLCFRSRNDSVTIYYNNHIVWNLSITKKEPKVSISANHARYSDNWPAILKAIGMDSNIVDKKAEMLKNGKVIDFDAFSRSAVNLPEGYTRNTLHYLIGMIDDYFDAKKDWDYFKNRKAHKGYDRQKKEFIEGKRDLVEKKRQQEFFQNNRSLCGGYFVYDMEYKHEYGNQEEMDADFKYMGVKKANQTDCLAIKFDDHGNPIKLAFVEIKSLDGSMTDNKINGSGLKAHMINMDKYITMHPDYMKLRLEEAKDILILYYKLGLRGVSKDMSTVDFSKLALPGNQEIVLVYTDSARKYVKSESGKKWLERTLSVFPTQKGVYDIENIYIEG